MPTIASSAPPLLRGLTQHAPPAEATRGSGSVQRTGLKPKPSCCCSACIRRLACASVGCRQLVHHASRAAIARLGAKQRASRATSAPSRRHAARHGQLLHPRSEWACVQRTCGAAGDPRMTPKLGLVGARGLSRGTDQLIAGTRTSTSRSCLRANWKGTGADHHRRTARPAYSRPHETLPSFGADAIVLACRREGRGCSMRSMQRTGSRSSIFGGLSFRSRGTRLAGAHAHPYAGQRRISNPGSTRPRCSCCGSDAGALDAPCSASAFPVIPAPHHTLGQERPDKLRHNLMPSL